MNLYSVTYVYNSRDLNRTRFNVTDTVIANSCEEAAHYAVKFLRRGSYSIPNAILVDSNVCVLGIGRVINHEPIAIAA